MPAIRFRSEISLKASFNSSVRTSTLDSRDFSDSFRATIASRIPAAAAFSLPPDSQRESMATPKSDVVEKDSTMLITPSGT